MVTLWGLGLSLAAIVGVAGCAGHGHGGHEQEENEVKVSLADCPPAVQATLKREAGTGMIAEVDKETEHGQTIYEADTTIDGKNYEIKVAEDGSLIAKKLDHEEYEKK